MRFDDLSLIIKSMERFISSTRANATKIDEHISNNYSFRGAACSLPVTKQHYFHSALGAEYPAEVYLQPVAHEIF